MMHYRFRLARNGAQNTKFASSKNGEFCKLALWAATKFANFETPFGGRYPAWVAQLSVYRIFEFRFCSVFMKVFVKSAPVRICRPGTTFES